PTASHPFALLQGQSSSFGILWWYGLSDCPTFWARGNMDRRPHLQPETRRLPQSMVRRYIPAMLASEIRQRFLDYFARNGHAIRPSSSLMPEDDPTLLFTNAGMVQFKKVFLGLENPAFGRRATTSQKSVQA